MVFVDACALVRPLHGARHTLVGQGLRVPVDSSEELSYSPEQEFLYNHREELDTFVLI